MDTSIDSEDRQELAEAGKLLNSLSADLHGLEDILEHPREVLERAVYEREGYWSRILTPEERIGILNYLRQIVFSLAWQLYGDDDIALMPDELHQPISLQVLLAYCSGVFEKLSRIISLIDQSPHQRLLRERIWVEFSLAKKAGGRTLDWLMSHPNLQRFEQAPASTSIAPGLRQAFTKTSPQGKSLSYIPTEIPESRVGADFNTYENRFLRLFLSSVHRDLDTIANLAESAGEDDIRIKAQGMKRELRELMQYDFLKYASALRGVRKPSVVFQKQPHYRQAYEIYRYYKKVFAFDWGNPVFQLPLQHTWLLYEYWCLFKIVEALEELGFRPTTDKTTLFFQDAEERTVLEIPKGVPATLAMKRDVDRAEMVLFYSSQFPDETLLDPSEGNYHLVSPVVLLAYEGEAMAFDIRFKNYEGQESWQDDLDRLHAYRDALHGSSRLVKEAWCIYPSKAMNGDPEESAPSTEPASGQSPRDGGIGLLGLHPRDERAAQTLAHLLARRFGLGAISVGSSLEEGLSEERNGSEGASSEGMLASTEPESKHQTVTKEKGESSAQFRDRAARGLSEVLGVELKKGKVKVRDMAREFDMVSSDETAVGAAVQLNEDSGGTLSQPKRALVAQQVWLMQNLAGSLQKFIVFSNHKDDRTLATRWLTEHKGLTQGIDFYFLDSKDEVARWQDGLWQVT